MNHNFANLIQVFKLHFIYRIGKKYIGCSLAECVDVTIKFDKTIEKEADNFTNLNIGCPIVFKVRTFIPSQKYIEGIIDKQVLDILKSDCF